MSGFEGSTAIQPIPPSATSDDYQLFSGTDGTTGYSWPMNFWGANASATGTHAIVGGTNLVSSYINNYIENVTGHTGAATNALRMNITGPAPGFCCIQSTFQIAGMSQQVGDFYTRFWLKLNPEFLTQVQANGSNFWRTVLELKTYTDYRIATFIVGNSNGVPSWEVVVDNTPEGPGPTCPAGACWTISNSSVSVPTGQWFLMEYYLHRSTANDGRFFWAVNGQTIVDHSGPTYGANQENIDFLAFLNLYGNAPNMSPAYQWVDDIEVWDLPPCSTLPCGAGTGGTQSDPPTAPSNLTATSVSGSQINLSWNASTGGTGGVAGYRVYRNGGATPVSTVTGTSYQDTGLSGSTTYTYNVVAYDIAGNASPASNMASATTAAAPTDLVLGMTPTSSTTLYSPSYITDGSLNVNNYAGDGTGLQWIQFDLGQTYALTNVNLWHYYGDTRSYYCVIVQISGVADFSSGVKTVFNNDQSNSCGLGAGANALYTETAAGNLISFSPVNGRYIRLWANGNTINTYNHYSQVVVYGTPNPGSDTAPPTIPTGLAAVAASSSQINLSWNASSDNVGVAGYRIYRNGGSTPIATVTGTNYQDKGLSTSTTYSYSVSAFDAAGNTSAQSAAASAMTLSSTDTTPPSTPTGLTATAVSSRQINLIWQASTDNVGVAGYRVYRNGGATPIATITGTSYQDAGLSQNTTYTYQVTAFDAAGNTSGYSITVSATTFRHKQ